LRSCRIASDDAAAALTLPEPLASSEAAATAAETAVVLVPPMLPLPTLLSLSRIEWELLRGRDDENDDSSVAARLDWFL
jgi:hypothetical protein